MKKISYLLAAFLVSTFLTAGCIDWVSTDSGEVPVGVSFYTFANLSFYFVDEDGQDLITFEDRDTWPVASPRRLGETERMRVLENVTSQTFDGGTIYLYNDGANSVYRENEASLWRFQSFVWGRTVEPVGKTFISLKSGMDSLSVSYKYISAAEANIDGGSWAVDVESVKYNDVEVFVGNENGKVFVQKPSHGSTIVKVGSL